MSNDSPASPGTWREQDSSAVAFGNAKAAWAEAAREILIATARQYHAYVTYGVLAERVQRHTGIHTRSQMRNWIGEVLILVADQSIRQNEPLLTSLCVRQDETVGDGYARVVERSGDPMPEDLDQHAAEFRLACYRYFGAELPADGGHPTLTRKVADRRNHTDGRKERSPRVCPRCYVVLPTTGVCDECV